MTLWLTDLLSCSGWQVQALAFATRDEQGEIVYRKPAGRARRRGRRSPADHAAGTGD